VLENYIPKDIVDEQKHILSFFVTEVLKKFQVSHVSLGIVEETYLSDGQAVGDNCK
jgi:hypothetical protein